MPAAGSPRTRRVRRHPDIDSRHTGLGYGALIVALFGALLMLGESWTGSYVADLVRAGHWVTVTEAQVRIGETNSRSSSSFSVAAVRVKIPGSSQWLPLGEVPDQPALDRRKDWPIGWVRFEGQGHALARRPGSGSLRHASPLREARG